MERIPGWLVPFVLAVTQLAVWPGIPLASGDRLSAPAVATGVTATVVAAVALLWRRSAPTAAIGVVAAAVTVGTYGVPTDALLVVSIADLIVLYSIAVLRSRRRTLGIAAAAAIWQTALVATTTGPDDFALEVVSILVVYASVVAFGRARHRWHAERTTAAARLAEAEERRARAADTERHRLARELHDVTAHHLTSIVVIASAAQRLGGTRPDLVAEAREFAARTGRDTLGALHRLVALLQLPDERPGPVAARLEELAEGFRLLGQHVSVRADPGELPGATTEAVCGIAREALTNTLRYAPAGGVRIRLTAGTDGLELTVDDDGARTDGVTAMGSGRGIAGMRERAAALGGTLTAGPRPDGGWRVRAVLPPAGAPAPDPRPRRRLPDSERVIDVVLFLLALFPPVGALLVTDGDPDLAGAPVPLLILVASVHAVPVIWRRTHPWAVLAAVALTSWLLPALIVAGPVAPALGWVMPAGLGAEAVAVYAVARYGRRNNLTALAIPAAFSSAVLASGVTLALDAPPEEEIPFVVWAVFMSAIIGCPLGLPMVGSWLTGFLVRRRRARLEAREHDAVASSTAQAIWEAGLERARVAAGLQAAVLRDTARVATAADAGDLDQVLTSARTALDAMRGLLNGLRAEPDRARDAGDRDPQPTTAALPGLADRWRANGREVGLEVSGAGRTLPADVDLSAFRVVELLLAGDTGPATVRVDLTGDPLRISMRPMPADEGGEIAAGLRARLAAVGGSMAAASDGHPEILLPAPATHPGGSSPVSGLAPLPVAEGSTDVEPSAGPAGASDPAGEGEGAAGTIPADDRPGTPAGDDKEVASSPSG